MCSSSNEPNFSFVYSYYTDPRVVEAQRVQEEVIANCKHNVEILTNEMTELKTILAAITMKYKVAEDARKVMYKRNSILMDDNAFLQQKLKETEMYRAAAEKAADSTAKELKDTAETVKRLETALKEIISEGLHQDRKKRRALLVREKTTSTTDIPALMESTPDGSGDNIDEDFAHTQAEKPLEDEKDEAEDEQELVRVKSAKSLQEKAAGDSKKMTKSPPKETAPERALDRVRHSKLVKVSQELERLKHMNSWKTSELGFKSRELKMKDAELAEAKKEILLLKNKLTQNTLSRKRMNAKKWIENASQKRIAFKSNANKNPPPKSSKEDEPKG